MNLQSRAISTFILGQNAPSVNNFLGMETSLPIMRSTFVPISLHSTQSPVLPAAAQFPVKHQAGDQEIKEGSSPNRVGGKDTRGFSAPGVRPVPGGTESAGTTRIPERLPGFRKAPVPDPLRKTESQLPSGRLHHDPTRTDGRKTASLCPVRDGMRPRGPSRLPPRQPTCCRRKIDRIHPLDREKILKEKGVK
jgi:hypothetical protein